MERPLTTGASGRYADRRRRCSFINLPSTVAVYLSDGSVSVNSLQVNNTLVLDGGSLTVAGNLVNAGAIHLASTDANSDAALIVNGAPLTNTTHGLYCPPTRAPAASDT